MLGTGNTSLLLPVGSNSPTGSLVGGGYQVAGSPYSSVLQSPHGLSPYQSTQLQGYNSGMPLGVSPRNGGQQIGSGVFGRGGVQQAASGTYSTSTPVNVPITPRNNLSALAASGTPSASPRGGSKTPSAGIPPSGLRLPCQSASTVVCASLASSPESGRPSTPTTRRVSAFFGKYANSKEAEEDIRIKGMCDRIDTDGNGFITKLELIVAVQRDPEIAKFVLPGSLANRSMEVDGDGLMVDELSFDAVDAAFDEIAQGKQRIKVANFFEHFQAKAMQVRTNTLELRNIFNTIDTSHDGSVSKLELIVALHKNREVGSLVLPGVKGTRIMKDESIFDAVNCVFEAISGGKKRFDYADFEMHFGKAVPMRPTRRQRNDRSQVRVFIIGPGFGGKLNPRQGGMISEAGFQVAWCHDIPNPEQHDFPVHPHLHRIKQQMDAFAPDVVCAASKGGIYAVRLWQTGYWRGPTVLINVHPTCLQLPNDIPIVVAQGDRDEVYPRPRADVEQIISTGGRNLTFLYYVASSGELSPGVRTLQGDQHNMQSLLMHDCLPRLIDATLCPDGPETHMIRSWRERNGDDRLEAEDWLGYTPEQLRKRWTSRNHRGHDERRVWDVPVGSDEFHQVIRVFKAAPREAPAYQLGPQAVWECTRIVNVQRIENGLQVDGSAKPYFDALRRSLQDQNVDFEPGIHTRWAFHGADQRAIESIIDNPVSGVQPLVAGSRGAQLWGSGTYLARDAKYVAEGGFCGQPGSDGTRKMLMCLTMTGIPCVGDPQQRGLLPMRQKPHRYHSSVDSLSNPEIYIVQHAGAVLPAYVITFV